MNRDEFLKLLRFELEANGVSRVQDILSDYEEHFTHGLSKGKSEEEISKKLGSPLTIASAYKTESMIQEIKSGHQDFNIKLALNIVMRLLVLAPFNFIVLFVPGIIIFTIMVTGWSMAAAFGGISLGVLTVIPEFIALSLSGWGWTAIISTSLGFLCMTILTGMIMYVLTKYILMGLIGYLQWNLRFIKDK